jgi:hypothetical protein
MKGNFFNAFFHHWSQSNGSKFVVLKIKRENNDNLNHRMPINIKKKHFSNLKKDTLRNLQLINIPLCYTFSTFLFPLLFVWFFKIQKPTNFVLCDAKRKLILLCNLNKSIQWRLLFNCVLLLHYVRSFLYAVLE